MSKVLAPYQTVVVRSGCLKHLSINFPGLLQGGRESFSLAGILGESYSFKHGIFVVNQNSQNLSGKLFKTKTGVF